MSSHGFQRLSTGVGQNMKLNQILPLVFVFSSLITFGASAAPLSVEVRSLGSIEPKLSESKPGIELFALIERDKAKDVYVVTGTVALNSNVKDHYKWFYDARARKLVLMCRTQMTTMSDSFRWRIWDDVAPTDFRTGIPFLNDALKTRASPYGSGANLPLRYPENRDLTEWP